MNLTAESHVRATRAGLNWMKLPPHVLNHFSKADLYNLINDRKSPLNPQRMGGLRQVLRHCRSILHKQVLIGPPHMESVSSGLKAGKERPATDIVLLNTRDPGAVRSIYY